MIGQTIAHYRILAKLGEGGMGAVYRAEDTRLGRQVALKFLTLPESQEEPWEAALRDAFQDTPKTKSLGPRERFLQEARAASALNHPGIITIYDIGESEGRLYIAMELVEGETLRRRVERGGLEGKELLRMAASVAATLARAHEAGIVHRDLKPENIMLLPAAAGQTKLLDFGIAKLKRPAAASEGATLDTARTMPGQILGTVHYMSPEQSLGREADHRSDLFSFGSVLYECVTGKKPFEGEMVDVMYHIAHNPPRPLEGDAELVRIIEKLMEKDPADRYQSAADLAVDLRRLERQPTAAAPPAPHKARETRAVPGLILLASLLLGGILVFLIRPAPPTPAQVYPVTHLRQTIRDPALSPDGRMLAFIAGEDHQVFVALTASGDATQLTRTPGSKSFPRFSPDGARILYAAGDGLNEIPALGGTPRRVLADAHLGVWSPNGSRLAFTRLQQTPAWTSELYAGDARGNNARKLDEALGTPSIFAAWTPDGSRLVYVTAYRTAFRLVELRVISVNGGPPKTLASENLIAAPPAVSADGKWAYYSAVKEGLVNIWRVPVEGGPAQQVTYSAGEDHSPALGANGQMYYVSARHRTALHLFDDQGSHRVLDEVLVSDPAVAPGGKRIAFVRTMHSQTYLGEIMLVSSDGSNLQRLDSPGFACCPTWSADGRLLGFNSRSSGRMTVHVVEPETGKQWPAIGENPFNTSLQAFSPSGELLLLRSKNASEDRTLLAHDLNTGKERTLGHNMWGFGWSADGRWAGAISDSRPQAVFLIPAAGGAPQKIYDNAIGPPAFHPTKPEVIIGTRRDLPQWVAIPINEGRGGTPKPWSSKPVLDAFAQFGVRALEKFDPGGKWALMKINQAEMDIFRVKVDK